MRNWNCQKKQSKKIRQIAEVIPSKISGTCKKVWPYIWKRTTLSRCVHLWTASRRESESVAPSLDSLTTTSTSLQPQKDAFTREVFATKPKILFCDLFLEPRESKTFDFEDIIQVSAPHSYNGRGLKYAYRVIVATQRLNQSIASLRIPFRVISVSSLNLNEIEVNDIICLLTT